jgi:signal transduction histidine kinase/DNA-binding response OmpR family regulator
VAASRILVVDDDPVTVRLLEELLTRQGHSVVRAGSGEEALDHLASHPCDLLLLDVRLPGMSGYEACVQIRERYGAALPVLMLTAHGDADSARRSYDAGADDYLLKPTDNSSLVLKVRAFLRSKALHDDLVASREVARARARNLALLHEVGRDWSLIEEPAAFYRMVTQRLGRLIGAPICMLGLYDATTRTLEAAVPAYGLPDDVTRRLRIEDYHSPWNFESGRAYLSNDARADPRLAQAMVSAVGAESAVLVPMLAEGEPVGLLAAVNKPGGFTDADVQLLTIFAGPAATFLRSREIYEAQRRHNTLLQRLPKLMGVLAATTARGPLLDLTTALLQKELGYEAVGFYAPSLEDAFKIEWVAGDADSSSPRVDHERLRWALRGGVPLQSPLGGEFAELAVPVGTGEQAQGVLNVRRSTRGYPEEEVALLTALAGQLALALQRADSIARTERLAKQMATLYDLGLETAPLRDLKRLFVKATEEAGRLIQADHTSAFRFDEAENVLRLFVAWTSDPARELYGQPVFRVGEGIAGCVARDWVPAMVNDVDTSGDFVPRGNPLSRILCVPLTYFDQERGGPALFGVLNSSRRPGSPRFTHEDLDYIQRFASQLSVAVANSMAYAAQRERSEQLTLVNKVIREIAGNLSRERVLETAVRRIHEAFHFALVMICVPDREAAVEHTLSVSGPEPVRLLRQDYAFGTGITGRAMRERRTVIVRDVKDDLDYVSVLDSTRSEVAIPILSGADVVAVLNVESDGVGAFGRSEVMTLETLAESIGIILRNAELYKALEETNARLVELDRLKSEVVNVVAHDFRAPLAGVLGHAEVLEMRPDLPVEERLDSVRAIVRSATHMASLVEKTLKTTRLETGHFPFDFGLADLGAIVSEVLARRPGEPAREIEAELPEDPIPVWADRSRLAEVIENLLSNAAKYSPKGGRIRLQVKVAGEKAQVRVEDRGIGIAPEHMGRLFRPFSRIRTLKTAGIEGSGLGLYICERVVRAHGGQIWAESEPDRGSAFCFTLPVYGVEAQTRAPVMLVAAADEGTRRQLRRVGEELGYSVEEARDGVESVEAAIRLRPAAIVLDRILPRLRAEEVAERLREVPATTEVPLFVLADEEELKEAARFFEACLPKPFDPARLQSALETLMTRAR